MMARVVCMALFFMISFSLASASVYDSFLLAPDEPSGGLKKFDRREVADYASIDLIPAARSEFATETTVSAPFNMPAIARYDVVVDKPLFSETRRPPITPAPEPPKVVESPPAPVAPPVQHGQFSLFGVVIDSDETFALIKHRSNGELLRVAVGQVVENWQIADIQPDAITIIQRGEEDVISLHAKGEVKQSASASSRIPTRRIDRNAQRGNNRTAVLHPTAQRDHPNAIGALRGDTKPRRNGTTPQFRILVDANKGGDNKDMTFRVN